MDTAGCWSRCELKQGLKIGPDPDRGDPSGEGEPRCQLPPCREGCTGQVDACYDVAECTHTVWMNAVRHLLY
jgi:hypothetical protein